MLLCSDGLTDMVHEDAIAAELRREPDPVDAAHKLVDAANAAGGVDNITVVVVAVTDEAGTMLPATLLRPPSPIDARRRGRLPRRASSTTSPSPAARRGEREPQAAGGRGVS